MKYSELNINNLTDDDIYDLIMSGVVDYSKQDPTPDNNPDFLIVLGCSPSPLEARVVKMMELYKKGFGKNILLSGGTGWHKLFKTEKKVFKSNDEMTSYLKLKAKKHKEMKRALKKTIFAKTDDKKIKLKKGKNLYRYLNKKYKKTLENTEAEIAYKIMRASQSVLEIPDERVFFEPDSVNTIQNLQYSKKILDSLQSEGKVGKIKRIMIITSSFHCRRAVLSFKKHFPNIDVLACPATKDIKDSGSVFEKESLMKNEYYMKEFKKEISAIKNYTKNGSIEDAEIEEYIKDEEILKRIKAHQKDVIER